MPDYYDGKASKQEETNNSTGNGSRVSKFDSNNFGLDVASLKIIELSKKIRELNAALVSERNKCNNLHQVIRKLESNSTNSLNKELVCHLCKRNKIGSLDEKIKV
ncbi:unnamed protein product [Heterobilharzia americana]|nr:unnamed protein product [Heterobilharzia americana]